MFLQRFIVIVFLGLLTGVTSQGVPGVKLSKRQGLCQAGYAACPQASDFCCPETKPYCVVDTETETVSCVPLVYCTSDTVACPMNVGYCCGLAESVVDKNGDVGCYDGTTTVAATRDGQPRSGPDRDLVRPIGLTETGPDRCSVRSRFGLGSVSVRSRSHTSWTDRSDRTGPVGPM